MKYTIVIPAFNEEATIAQVLADIKQNFSGLEYEVIVVDDCSTDNTAREVRKAVGVKLITHRSNKGYGMSIKKGIKEAAGEFIITMDADGQHRAQDAMKLLAHIDKYDMVVGARKGRDNITWRIPGKCLVKRISEYLVGQKIPDINSGLKAFSSSVIKRYLHLCSDKFSFSTTSLLAYLSDGLEVKFVEIDVTSRKGGSSTVRIRDGLRALLFILQVIMTFNPLKIFLNAFFALSLFTVIYVVWGLIYAGSISKSSVILVISALLVFLFGLIADQISKIRKELTAYYEYKKN